jgi:ferredoxin
VVSSLRVHVDRDRCQGTGSCAFHAPGRFDVGDDVKVVVLDGPASDAELRAAVESCPTRALTLEPTGAGTEGAGT